MDELDAMMRRIRLESGITDERARELVGEWRERAQAAERSADELEQRGLPFAAARTRGQAVEYRRDAADLERQL